MNKNFGFRAALIAFGLLSTACTVSDTKTETGAPLARQIFQSVNCGLSAPGHLLIDNAQKLARLEALPTRNLSPDLLRGIDYRREYIVLASIGRKPTGGFGVTLVESEIVDDVLQLTIRVTEPAPGTIVTQALTTPCAVIAVTSEGWDDIQITRAENNR